MLCKKLFDLWQWGNSGCIMWQNSLFEAKICQISAYYYKSCKWLTPLLVDVASNYKQCRCVMCMHLHFTHICMFFFVHILHYCYTTYTAWLCSMCMRSINLFVFPLGFLTLQSRQLEQLSSILQMCFCRKCFRVIHVHGNLLILKYYLQFAVFRTKDYICFITCCC